MIIAVVAVTIARRFVGFAAGRQPEHVQAEAGEGGREAGEARIVRAVGVGFVVRGFVGFGVPFEGLEEGAVFWRVVGHCFVGCRDLYTSIQRGKK